MMHQPLLTLCCTLSFLPAMLAGERPTTFERDIQPVLTRAGCNAGACHGKARGQNGFALSLLGFDADMDFNAITKEARGRRLFPANPDESLFLRKASGTMPHGGGKKLPLNSPGYQLLRDWIASGTPRTPADAPKLVKVTVEPALWIAKFQDKQKLKVIAHYDDQSQVDVTGLAAFQSNEAGYAKVDEHGQIDVGTIPGEVAVTARFVDQFAVCQVLIPLPGQVDAQFYAELPQQNFIDGHIWNKLQQLQLTPSEQTTEAGLHRRLYQDLIGRFPTVSETRTYLENDDLKKREKLIDSLLSRPEYGDFWANKWADLLRPNPYHVGIKATWNFDAWIREQFRNNVPYDQFVRDLLTAQGSTFRDGATVFFRNRRDPAELTTMVSQLFLGVRLECAKCHQHPSERWSQHDFYSFASFFSRIGRKGQGISAPISGGEEIIFVRGTGLAKHPLTAESLLPKPLLAEAQTIPETVDPRQELVQWMTAKNNPFFAKVMVNRVWADLMGRGLVDPVDDMRDTNPPSNPALLEALAQDFRDHDYDIKHLLKTIASSHAYSLSSIPGERNLTDTRNYSRHYRHRLRAEVLLDAVSDITGITENLSAMPKDARAMQAWTVRFDSKFLDSFGRPDPNQDPPCERSTDTTVVQALHLMNSQQMSLKITSDDGLPARLAKSDKTPKQIIEELYLAVYSRYPKSEEWDANLARFEKSEASRRTVTEDLLWALFNTPEFVLGD